MGDDPVATVAGIVGVRAPLQESMVYIETESPFKTYANSGGDAGTQAPPGGVTVELPPPQLAARTTSRATTAVRK
jgi:hypothetical protein